MKFWARALSASSLILAASTAHAATLTVVINNIKSDVGDMTISVYNSKETWLGEDSLARNVVTVADHLQGDTLSTEFELEPGDYGVAIQHDANDNGKMDTNFMGIPKEPMGLSNDVVPRFGPPKWKNSVFTVPEEGLEKPIRMLD